ncbi:MAG TPA: sigma-70 family RNA polymerase sigma factor [Candidatus Acidoferrum sp.]|jgi:RNA polymerase sigma factor (sigma-70 family)|nr:sigma-70 family RNA polymerase sigma factor [Candidatus Acidoferrum sp.]
MSAARVIPGHDGGSRNSPSDAVQFMSDEALVAGAKLGRGSFFEELHARHREKMFSVASRITRHHGDAQDAVQESFINAYIHLKEFDGRAKFGTWLTRIAINAALMKTRKNRTSREVGMDDAGDAVELHGVIANPEEIYATTERKAALREAIAKLRPTLRHVVELHDLQEQSVPEIAEALSISVAAAKARLFHARAALRRMRLLEVRRSRRRAAG